MNSTPSTLARIMRFTALQPPPPTPITLIFAPSKRSSLNEILIADSFAVIVLPPIPGRRRPLFQSRLLTGEHAFQFRHQFTGALPRPPSVLPSLPPPPHTLSFHPLRNLSR